jgi:hypothetical protein
MPFFSIDSDNNLAVHPDKEAAIKEAGATGAVFATEAQLSEAAASWPTSRMVEVWNGFAGAPPFADLKEVKKFTDRKTATARILNAAQRLGNALEKEQKAVTAPVVKAAKASVPAAAAPTAPAQAPAKAKATKGTTGIGAATGTNSSDASSTNAGSHAPRLDLLAHDLHEEIPSATSVTANTPAAEGVPKTYRIEVKLAEVWQPVLYFDHAETEIERISKAILKSDDWTRLLEPSAELEFLFSVQLVDRCGNESTGPFGTFAFPVADLRKIQWENMDAARLFNLASAINLKPVARGLVPEWCADADNQRSTLVWGTN